jgi:flagellar motor switch protein FliG
MAILSKLKTMKDSEIQAWLRKVGREKAATLAVALLGADEAVRSCVLRNMSKTAAVALQQELEKQGMLRVDENSIRRAAQEMEELL